ncbi:type II secretion system GspH family protein [Patescibacteria group bacterium]|nr:type II secretion system GspH family protein [Patescibacteria group bacterium]
MLKKHKLAGITIPELLIGLLIVGVVISIFVYALGIQRATSRDAKRVSDISVMRASFGQYWLLKATYPVSEGVYLGSGAGADRLAGSGLTTVDDTTAPILLDYFPAGPKSGEYYAYRGNDKGYSLLFMTERETAYGPSGTYFAHSTGVDQLDEIK